MAQFTQFLKRQWPWLLGGLFSAVLLGGAIHNEGPFGNSAAAWLQAIGALVALTVSGLESHRLQKAERERRATPLEIAAQASRNVLLYYDSFEKGLPGKDIEVWALSYTQPGPVDGVLAPFREVALRDMPTAEAVEVLIGARTNAEFLVERIRGAAKGAAHWQDGSVTTRTRMWHAWMFFSRERDRMLGRPVPPWPTAPSASKQPSDKASTA